MKSNFEKINSIGFGVLFAIIAVLCVIGGFKGGAWHFYPAVLSTFISVVLFREASID